LRGKKFSKDPLGRARMIEEARMNAVQDSLVSRLTAVLKSFPGTAELDPFYVELLKCTLDFVQLKKSFGALAWAVGKINEFCREYVRRVHRVRNSSDCSKERTTFYGRVSSVMRQIRKNLVFLEECRKTMRDYPSIKTGIPTVVIFGFPNVGKTTLLSKLTGSKPEIAPYAFTTKGVNIGNMVFGKQKVQVLDTPGTLDRFEKMNNIEKIAHLALKHVADVVIYVFDPTEPYPMEKQKELFRKLSKIKKPLVYWSKADIVSVPDAVSVEGLRGRIQEELKLRPDLLSSNSDG